MKPSGPELLLVEGFLFVCFYYFDFISYNQSIWIFCSCLFSLGRWHVYKNVSISSRLSSMLAYNLYFCGVSCYFSLRWDDLEARERGSCIPLGWCPMEGVCSTLERWHLWAIWERTQHRESGGCPFSSLWSHACQRLHTQL